MNYEGQVTHKVISTTNTGGVPKPKKIKIKDAAYLMAKNRPLTLWDLFEFDTVTSFADMWIANTLVERIDLSDICAVERVSCNEICKDCLNVKEIVMPSITPGTIYSAFMGCTSMENIVFPQDFNAKMITDARNTFSNCISLIELDLSLFDFKMTNSTVGNQNFLYGCKNIRKLWVPSDITIRSVQEKYGLTWGIGNETCLIYTDAKEKPSAWGTYWNSCAAGKTLTVIWGATHEEYEQA
ncbi:hypothetical protein [uncultured Clostridium sp.]|uniref:hypothetical protein n=1 Tax=uncultured Clostridium sp. TaxID=59620 RepID=UPI0025DCE072|nr:hypothetical protein [uncultured Clostridium sp.]